MRIILLIALLAFASCNSQKPTTEPEPTPPVVTTPSEPTQPEMKLGPKISLWSTYYFIPKFDSQSSGYPLRDMNAKALTKNLSLDHWCFVGLQGTVNIDGKTFGYTDKSTSKRVPCEKSFLRKVSFAYSTGNVKFHPDAHEFGTGNKNNPLTPFKSIACDQGKYKFKQKFFIPSAKGTVLPDGSIHDGVFICEDVGGAIKRNHIDTFIGFVDMRGKDFSKRYSIAFATIPKQMRNYIKSESSGSFDAYLILE